MKMPINSFKAALGKGRQLAGIRTSLCSPTIVDVLASCGFDYVYIDTEHTPADMQTVQAQLRALHSTSALVRPAANDEVLIKKLLDIGVQNLLIPMVQDAASARRAVAATRYSPRGSRGVCGRSGANAYGRIEDYYTRADDEICVITMLETRGALDRLEEIAGVDGVDALWVGPGDLAADFGVLTSGGPAHPEVRKALEDAVQRAQRAGKPIGIPAPTEAQAKELAAAGCALITVSSDVDILAREGDRLAALMNDCLHVSADTQARD